MVGGTAGTPKQALILLACRGGAPDSLFHMYFKGLKDFVVHSLASVSGEWYPQPNGPHDQKEALKGLSESVNLIDDYVDKVAKENSLSRGKVHLAGHSAGGVVALQVAVHSKVPFGSVHVHCGAILEPGKLPKSNDTPVFVFHGENDSVFKWHERYLPMKTALIKGGYNCAFVEHYDGHVIRNQDVKSIRKFLMGE